MKALLVFLLMTVAAAAADRPPSAEPFAGQSGVLSEEQAALYLVYRNKIPLVEVAQPGSMTVDPVLLMKSQVVQDALSDLAGRVPQPWTWQKLDKDAGLDKPEPPSPPPSPLPPGITDGYKLQAIRLRKTQDDIAKELKDAKGASISFSNNRRLPGSGAWNSEGVLFLPFQSVTEDEAKMSRTRELGPTVQWKVAETQEPGKADVQEVTYSLSMIQRRPLNVARGALEVIQARPYLQTDFSGSHRIFGAQATYEYIGYIPKSEIHLGGYANVGDKFQYQLRAVPKIDYSDTEKSGKYTTRTKDDDWLRLGGLISLDLRSTHSVLAPFELGISFEFFETLDGNGGYAKLVKERLSWWFNENVGVTLENSEGETPIAAKDIDLLTLGLEIKY